MFYYLGIVFATALVALLNILFAATEAFGMWHIILASALSTVSVILVDGLFAAIVRWLFPKKWFSVDKNLYAASRKECRFYEKIGIKNWKEKVPELGQFTNFRKNKISEPTNNEFVSRYIIEANYGVACHFAGMIFGFLIMLLYPSRALIIGLPISIVNLFYNSLSFFILRYNLPKLHTLYRINVKRSERVKKEKKLSDETISENSVCAQVEVAATETGKV